MIDVPRFPDFPETLAIRPLDRPPNATVIVPGSKSITNRALVLAAMSEQPCKLLRPLYSDATYVMAEALRQLGHIVELGDEAIYVERALDRPLIPVEEAELYVANSGTSMRFLAALVSLGHGDYRLLGDERMHERPIE